MTTIQRVPLHLSGGNNVRYRDWPVTQGIPFADEDLRIDTPVRVVDATGRPRPTQAQCLTTWRKDRQFVKWLLVDFQADFAPGDSTELFLETGGGPAPEHPSPVRIKQDDDAIELDTGALQLRLRSTTMFRQNPGDRDFLAACRIHTGGQWQDMLPGRGINLIMKDARGGCYDTRTAGPRPSVEIEEAGPLRSSVCIKGYHASPMGVRFCPYILRLHVFAGSSDVRVFHTFIFDQEPHEVELAAVGLHWPVDLGSNLRWALGGDRQSHHPASDGAIRLLQTDDRTYRVFEGEGQVDRGGKSPGWGRLEGDRGSALVVIRDVWQEYPKGLAVDPGGIEVGIWPEHAPHNLVFTTPFEEPAILFNRTRDESEFQRLLAQRPSAPLNLKSLGIETWEDFHWVERMLARHADGRTVTHNDTGTSNGVGAAKTTEMLFRFSHGTTDDLQAGQVARAVQEPLIAPADPSHTCTTRAAGYVHPAGDPRFAEVDQALDDVLERVAIEPIETCRLYGMMRYGNMVCSHAPGPSFAYVHHRIRDPENALRHVGPYNNEANDQIGAVWTNFVRTGQREHYFLAQRYSRNVADVGMIHAHPTRPGSVGLMHYHACHQWSGGPSPSHTLLRGILMDYYFTGNRRLLEVAHETGHWLIHNQTPCGILACKDWRLHREFTGPMWNLFELYQATWEERYGDLARRSLNWFLRTLPEPGDYPISVFTRGERGDRAVVEPPGGRVDNGRDAGFLLDIAHRLHPSRALWEHIRAEVDHYLWDDLTDNFVTAEMARRHLTPRSMFWPVDEEFYWTQWAPHPLFIAASGLVPLVYEQTGETLYAAYARQAACGTFLRQARRVNRFADFRFTWLCFGSTIPAMVWTAARAMDDDPTGLEQADELWRRKRTERGMPVYDGPGVDFNRDEMDPIGNITSRPPVALPCEGPTRTPKPITDLGILSTDDHPPRMRTSR